MNDDGVKEGISEEINKEGSRMNDDGVKEDNWLVAAKRT